MQVNTSMSISAKEVCIYFAYRWEVLPDDGEGPGACKDPKAKANFRFA